MQEIVAGIFTWPWFSERHGYNFNGYLVCAAEGNICIDPVEPDAPTLDAIARPRREAHRAHQPQPRARRERGARTHRGPYRDPPR